MKLSSNSAISYSLLFRAWQAAAGLITIPIVIRTLEPAVQGYYYTFASLIAIQSFFELGLGIVISIYASHEWFKLRLDERGYITGDETARSRMISLGRFIFVYFGIAGVIYLLVTAVTGYVILDRDKTIHFGWLLPWLFHVLFSAISLWLMPFLSLLEGCNQVATTARFRLFQSVGANAAMWLALASGLGLWAAPVYSGVAATMLGLYITLARHSFFSAFLEPPKAGAISWKNDLFPMQWRLAVQAMFSYFTFPLYTVLAYSYLGAVEAGRMGMSLQVISGIQSFALVFLMARAPEFAMLAAAGKSQTLEAEWKTASVRSLCVMAGLFSLIGAAQFSAIELGFIKTTRILSTPTFLILATGALTVGVVQCIAVYLRAHKRELLTWIGVSAGALYGLSAWQISRPLGANGIAASYLAVTALVVLPLTLRVLRSNYRNLRS